mmetsp:Transcript_103512/g.322474  ORF Transcript_103512/g.322474 Transcript_103512/m.322474 type:complete len:288 (-) Transcript_103512:241-1104(-)
MKEQKGHEVEDEQLPQAVAPLPACGLTQALRAEEGVGCRIVMAAGLAAWSACSAAARALPSPERLAGPGPPVARAGPRPDGAASKPTVAAGSCGDGPQLDHTSAKKDNKGKKGKRQLVRNLSDASTAARKGELSGGEDVEGLAAGSRGAVPMLDETSAYICASERKKDLLGMMDMKFALAPIAAEVLEEALEDVLRDEVDVHGPNEGAPDVDLQVDASITKSLLPRLANALRRRHCVSVKFNEVAVVELLQLCRLDSMEICKMLQMSQGPLGPIVAAVHSSGICLPT